MEVLRSNTVAFSTTRACLSTRATALSRAYCSLHSDLPNTQCLSNRYGTLSVAHSNQLLQISKYESGALKTATQRAHSAVKSFALRVDRELWKYELNRRWEGIRKNLDRNSVGQLLGSKFTVID